VAVGLGLAGDAAGVPQASAGDPPRPPVGTTVRVTAADLLAEGRELAKQNRLGDALAKADAAVKLGGPTGADTPDALRRDVLADGKKQIDDLADQAKTLTARGDAVRAKASLELARQIAAEIGLPTAPTAAAPLPAAKEAIVPVVFHPAADPTPVTLPPVLPPLPALDVKPPVLPTPTLAVPQAAMPADEPAAKPHSLPTPPATELAPPPRPVQAAPEAEKLLRPAVSAPSFNPSGPSLPPVVPGAGTPTPPAPGDAPVPLPSLPKLATAAVGAALAAGPAPAQDTTPPKSGPGTAETAKPMPAPPAAVSKEQLDAVKADVDALKEYKKQVQDLLQGKADGTAGSVLDAGVLKRLTDLEAKLDRIEKAVESMRQSVAKLGDTTRSSLSPAAGGNPIVAPGTANRSAVRLVNDYPSELSIILNGTSHRLRPGETKAVDVPPGRFTYELIAEGAKAVTRTIRDDETVTLRIK
jgi:hypothetical protein